MEDFFGQYFGQYYGIDWLAMITAIGSIYYIGGKKRYGFSIGIIASLAWMFVNIVAQIWPGIFLNFILIGLHVRGYLNWGELESEKSEAKKGESNKKVTNK